MDMHVSVYIFYPYFYRSTDIEIGVLSIEIDVYLSYTERVEDFLK